MPERLRATLRGVPAFAVKSRQRRRCPRVRPVLSGAGDGNRSRGGRRRDDRRSRRPGRPPRTRSIGSTSKSPRFTATTRRRGGQRSWPMPSDIGAFALASDPPGAVVALRTGMFRLDFASGSLTRLAPPPFDPALFRFNEGACDAAGRFWVGVMFDPLDGAPPPQKSSLHSFTLGGGLRPEPDAAELHNGMAWSADGRLFYLSHSQQQRGVRLRLRRGNRPARRSPPFRTHPGGAWPARRRGRRQRRRLLVRAARRRPACGATRRRVSWTATSHCR